MSSGVNQFPRFRPQVIFDALFAQLKTAQFTFQTYVQRGSVPENIDTALQPYLALIPLGGSQLDSQAQGLERWILEYACMLYLRDVPTDDYVPAVKMNAAWQAVVNAMRSPQPTFRQQTLGGLVDNAWIAGACIFSGGIIEGDEQLRVFIPIKVSSGG